VSTREVAAFIRHPVVKAVEAPLGPTCVYVPQPTASTATKTRAGKGARARVKPGPIEVMIAVNAMSFKRVAARLSSVTSINISGHKGYCGVYGHPITYVSLAYGRVMTVSAPCPVGGLVAERALTHLTPASIASTK
jgi:hypothetical protein